MSNIYNLKKDLMNLIEKSQVPKFVDKNIFFRFLNNNDATYFSRENKEGHITSSCFCVNEDLTKTLLVKHKKFGLWLQPGGHWDDIDNLNISTLENAIKEVGEECFGEKPFEHEVMLGGQIFNLDAHSAMDHFHYDVGYLVKVSSENQVVINTQEADDVQWVDIDYVCNSSPEFTSSRVKEVFQFIRQRKQEILQMDKELNEKQNISNSLKAVSYVNLEPAKKIKI